MTVIFSIPALYSVPICYGTGGPLAAWSSARAKELLTHLFA